MAITRNNVIIEKDGDDSSFFKLTALTFILGVKLLHMDEKKLLFIIRKHSNGVRGGKQKNGHFIKKV